MTFCLDTTLIKPEKDKDIKKFLTSKELENEFKLKSQFKNIDAIFKRVFKEK